jgi:hypothetical protein
VLLVSFCGRDRGGFTLCILLGAFGGVCLPRLRMRGSREVWRGLPSQVTDEGVSRGLGLDGSQRFESFDDSKTCFEIRNLKVMF